MNNTLEILIRQIFRYFRYVYHRYFVTRQWSSIVIYKGLTVTKTVDLKESLFGYYNLSPENTRKSVLYGEPQDERLNLFCKNEAKTTQVGTTKAWNWQQGCMLQWSLKSEDIIYYNTFNEKSQHYVAHRVDINNVSDFEEIPMPICCVSNDESYALSLNFERLADMRPDYGYFCRKNYELPENDVDGIWKVDLTNYKTELIISLRQLAELDPVISMSGAKHKVNHIDISPDSARFMFLHRWVGPLGRFMRLITADKDGNNLNIINGDVMTSHSCWWGNNQIISFCHTPEFGNAYVVFNDKTNAKYLLSERLPVNDGHPSVSGDGKWMVTDTYPQFDRISKIYLFNLEDFRLLLLGSFYQPLKYLGSSRIDLHPKWNLQGDKIFFESGHNGFRNLYEIDVTDIVCK